MEVPEPLDFTYDSGEIVILPQHAFCTLLPGAGFTGGPGLKASGRNTQLILRDDKTSVLFTSRWLK